MGERLIFTWGRFQPPHLGHLEIVNAIKKMANDQSAEYIIFSSLTEDAKNPIPWPLKQNALYESFGPCIRLEKTFNDVLSFIEGRYTGITMVIGSDRYDDFKRILDSFTKKSGIPSCVISIGRDPDADDVSGISSTYLKKLAKEDNIKTFLKCIPNNMSAITILKIYRILKSI